LILKADNHIKPNTNLKPIKSIDEVKSDCGLLKHSSKVEIQLQSDAVHDCQNETAKKNSPPKMIESRSQLEFPPITSDVIITEPMQNTKGYKDIIMVRCFIFF
jgi:hypothetical protein